MEGCGQDLEQVQKIDLSGLHPRLRKAEITVMCDVDNPLCGAEGATHTFGAQKGGMPEMLETLEAGMLNYRRVLAKPLGKTRRKSGEAARQEGWALRWHFFAGEGSGRAWKRCWICWNLTAFWKGQIWL